MDYKTEDPVNYARGPGTGGGKPSPRHRAGGSGSEGGLATSLRPLEPDVRISRIRLTRDSPHSRGQPPFSYRHQADETHAL